MAQTRANTSSVLGKRPHRSSQVDVSEPRCDVEETIGLLTPDSTPNPKRVKTTTSLLDGDNNKENIPPFVFQTINGSPTTRRLTRSLRRASTMVQEVVSPPSTPRRHASTSNIRHAGADTPATALANLSLTTPPPTPPSILLPLHVRARALLRPTCNEGLLMAGREKERSTIEAFILDFVYVNDRTSGNSVLFVSGSPGTGKTALVHSILATLAPPMQMEEVQILFINCMALDGVDAVWQRLAESLGTVPKVAGRGKKSKDSPQEIVETRLAASERKCILILDELDHVATSTQSLSPIFTLAYKFSRSLRLVGIANTHTLTSTSFTTVSAQSLCGVQTVHFTPYTPQQLLTILQARLAPLSGDNQETAVVERVKNFLPLPTLTLLSKKIAAQTGDVRAVFEVLRGAIDVAITTSRTSDAMSSPTPSVTPSHILTALKAYAPAGKTTPSDSSITSAPSRRSSDSETVTKVRGLGLQQRLVLLTILVATKSSEAGVSISSSTPSRSPLKRMQSSSNMASKSIMFEMGHLHSFYSTILGRCEDGLFAPVSRSEFCDLAGVLEVVGLLAISTGTSLPATPRKAGKKSFSRSMSFTSPGSGSQEVSFVDGVRLDEVARGLGLGVDDSPTDRREEEVRSMFQREQARIARECKSHKMSSHGETTGFEDAIED